MASKRTLRTLLLIVFVIDILSGRNSPAADTPGNTKVELVKDRSRRDINMLSTILSTLGFSNAVNSFGSSASKSADVPIMGGGAVNPLQSIGLGASSTQTMDLFSRGLQMLKQITETQMTRNGSDQNDVQSYDQRMDAMRMRLNDLGGKVQDIINVLGQLQGMLPPMQGSIGALAGAVAQAPVGVSSDSTQTSS